MINDIIFTEMLAESERRKKEVQIYAKKRFLFDQLEEKKNIHIGIYGLRGTGKTVLMLQLANRKENSLYINVENLLFRDISIVEFVTFAEKKGFVNFFIDEIHESSSWAKELKMLYDNGFRSIVFSGSSSIKIQESGADLSRRALLFNLPPLSFREFLEMNFNISIEKVSFEELLNFEKRKEIILKLTPYSQHFEEYMKLGAFPFYIGQKENASALYKRIIDKIVRVDLVSIAKIDINYIENVYKIINILAISNPNEISYSSLSKHIAKDVYTVELVLKSLTAVGFLNAIRPYKKGAALIRKEYKFLISPPFRLTLASSLGYKFEDIVGGVREDVFIANTYQLGPAYIKTDRERKTPDYAISSKTFEVGAHKYKHDSDFYVKDGLSIETNLIPLPVFCLLF